MCKLTKCLMTLLFVVTVSVAAKEAVSDKNSEKDQLRAASRQLNQAFKAASKKLAKDEEFLNLKKTVDTLKKQKRNILNKDPEFKKGDRKIKRMIEGKYAKENEEYRSINKKFRVSMSNLKRYLRKKDREYNQAFIAYIKLRRKMKKK